MGFGERNKLEQRVQDVLKDVTDSRVVSWLVDGLINNKPSSLEEMIEMRETKITKKFDIAKKVKDYNQTRVTPQKTQKPKKKSQSNEIG
jgi:hypothetical protein